MQERDLVGRAPRQFLHQLLSHYFHLEQIPGYILTNLNSRRSTEENKDCIELSFSSLAASAAGFSTLAAYHILAVSGREIATTLKNSRVKSCALRLADPFALPVLTS